MCQSEVHVQGIGKLLEAMAVDSIHTARGPRRTRAGSSPREDRYPARAKKIPARERRDRNPANRLAINERGPFVLQEGNSQSGFLRATLLRAGAFRALGFVAGRSGGLVTGLVLAGKRRGGQDQYSNRDG